MVGPATGAFLSHLDTQYPSIFGGTFFFVEFPYALPCLVVVLVSFCSFILAYMYLTETLQIKDNHSKVYSNPLQTPTSSAVSPDDSDDYEEPSYNISLSRNSMSLYPSLRCFQLKSRYVLLGNPTGILQLCSGCLQSTFGILADTNIRTPIILYFLVGFVNISLAEVFPLWALNNATHHGLGFVPKQIGIVLVACALPQMASQLFLFPMLSKRWGYGRLLTITLTWYNLVCLYLCCMCDMCM